MSSNLFRIDPTRTVTLRRGWLTAFRKRIRAVKQALVTEIVTKDLFALSPSRPFTLNTSSDDVDRLRSQTEKVVEEQMSEKTLDGPWYVRWLRQAYSKGMGSAYQQAKKGQQTGDAATRAVDAAREAGNVERQPASKNVFAKIVQRTAEAIKTLGQAIVNAVVRVASSFTSGSKEKLASETLAAVDSTTDTKVAQIVNSEVVAAHAAGQLDMATFLGVTEVAVEAEFVTAGDKSVCKRCQALAGNVYTVDEARGLIPVHPSCRCSFRIKPLKEKT